jgi:hypothetical protein
MSFFSRLIRFEGEDGGIYFADLGPSSSLPSPGTTISAVKSLDALSKRAEEKSVTLLRVRLRRCSENAKSGNWVRFFNVCKCFQQLRAPLPRSDIPIYCVGLNYHSHAKEANVSDLRFADYHTRPKTSGTANHTNSFLFHHTLRCGRNLRPLWLTPERRFLSTTFAQKLC